MPIQYSPNAIISLQFKFDLNNLTCIIFYYSELYNKSGVETNVELKQTWSWEIVLKKNKKNSMLIRDFRSSMWEVRLGSGPR